MLETPTRPRLTGVAPVAKRPRARLSPALAVVSVAQFMVVLDLSMIIVALPSIQSNLAFSSGDLQWVVTAYAVTFAGFLLLGGRAVDRLGQRSVFVRLVVPVQHRLARGRRGREPRDAGDCPRGPGSQLRVHDGVVACDHDLVVPVGPQRSRRAAGFTERSACGPR